MNLDGEIDRACELFKDQINLYEDYLFGLTLFHETAPWLLRWIQSRAYRRTVARFQTGILRAKHLLAAVKAGEVSPKGFDNFAWPPRTQAMRQRITTMLDVYAMAFPSRPKKPLTTQELSELRESLTKSL